jgi:hypothetical protein
MEPEDPRLTAAARHALHDEELVAAFAVDGDAADDPSRARTLIERCTTCRDLHADLVAIGAVVRSAERAEAVAAVRPAPRDYRLTASDAARLRGGNSLQRVAARLVDAIATFGRPVGASLAAFGVVGLLVGSVTLGSLGGAASMPLSGPGAQAPAATQESGAVNGAAASPAADRSTQEPEASDARQGFTLAGEDAGLTSDGTSLLFAGSISLVVVGAALLLAGSRRHRPALARNRGRT